MNAEQLDQIIQGYLDKGYKYFWLQDREGKPSKATCVPGVCPTIKKSNPEQAKNIVPYVLKHPGVYILVVRRAHNAPDERITLDTRENEVTINQATNEPVMVDERDKQERRNDELYIRQLERENAKFESEIARWQDKVEDLEQKLDDIKADAEENAQSVMADQTVNTVGQVVQILPAILDKWFSLQEQKNQLMAEQLRRTAPQRPTYQPQNDQNSYHEEAGY